MTRTLYKVLEETIINLCESSDNARVVSSTRTLAHTIGFDEVIVFLIASAVSELSTNIIKYAGRGRVALRMIENGRRSGFEAAAQDLGPGIEKIEEAVEDHFSTGDSLGLGLGSVKRIMDEFEIKSKPGSGTTVVIRKWKT